LRSLENEEDEFPEKFVEIVIESKDGDTGKDLSNNLRVDSQFG
jgi:hypothetical protein